MQAKLLKAKIGWLRREVKVWPKKRTALGKPWPLSYQCSETAGTAHGVLTVSWQWQRLGYPFQKADSQSHAGSHGTCARFRIACLDISAPVCMLAAQPAFMVTLRES